MIYSGGCSALLSGGPGDAVTCRICPEGQAWEHVAGYYRGAKQKIYMCAEKEPSQQMHRALEVSVRLDKYPKSVIDVFVMVLDSDGGQVVVVVDDIGARCPPGRLIAVVCCLNGASLDHFSFLSS